MGRGPVCSSCIRDSILQFHCPNETFAIFKDIQGDDNITEYYCLIVEPRYASLRAQHMREKTPFVFRMVTPLGNLTHQHLTHAVLRLIFRRPVCI